MNCEHCHLEKRIIVTTTITLQRHDPRTGKESTETRTTHLCRACVDWATSG